MRGLGLEYGAIDLRLTPDGEYVFLEVNPAGQFLFVEHACGLPVSRVLARTSGERSCPFRRADRRSSLRTKDFPPCAKASPLGDTNAPLP
jgi:hypothetical protein